MAGGAHVQLLATRLVSPPCVFCVFRAPGLGAPSDPSAAAAATTPATPPPKPGFVVRYEGTMQRLSQYSGRSLFFGGFSYFAVNFLFTPDRCGTCYVVCVSRARCCLL